MGHSHSNRLDTRQEMKPHVYRTELGETRDLVPRPSLLDFAIQLLPCIDPYLVGLHCAAFGYGRFMGLSVSIPDHEEPKRQLVKGRKRSKNIFQAGFYVSAEGDGLLLERVMWP